MKRIYIAAALLLVVLAACFVSLKTVNKSTSALILSLNECEAAFGSDECEKLCKEFEKTFEKHKQKLSFFVNKSPLEETALSVSRLKVFEETKNKELFFAEAASIKKFLKEIKQDESFSFFNIY